MFRIAILAVLMSATAAVAQNASQPSAVHLPKGCETAAQAGGQMQMVDQMKRGMSMPEMGQMTETQKGLQQAMMRMNPPMMQGMMAKDADVAWICAMIPHHQGAIDMARAGLKGADNEESRKLAEETIKSNEKELKKLTAWVEKFAERESRNETTGATPKQ